MYDCFSCTNLDKSRKKKSDTTNHVLHGCNAKGRGYCVGWVDSDSELKLQGCSQYTDKPINEQLSLF